MFSQQREDRQQLKARKRNKMQDPLIQKYHDRKRNIKVRKLKKRVKATAVD
jgi:hypothetical protein